jgi:cell division protein FtsZ
MDDVLVVGVGGAGCDIASRVHERIGGRILAINTDSEALKNSVIADKLLIGSPQPGVVSRMGPEVIMRSMEASLEKLRLHLEGTRLLILLAGFGGDTGTGAVPVIANMALSQGIELYTAITLPFDYETHQRKKALAGLSELEKIGIPVFVYDHQSTMVCVNGKDLSLIDVLNVAGESIAENVALHINTLNQGKKP